MSTRDHSKFAEVMAGLLTVIAVIAVFSAFLLLCGFFKDGTGEPLTQDMLEEPAAQIEEPQEELADYFDLTAIALFACLFLMMLNPLQSCLYRLHPAWSIVFIAVLTPFFALTVRLIAFLFETVMQNKWELLLVVPIVLYVLLGLAASIIALIVRRGEWRKRRFRDAPCYWWDIFMVYTIFLLGTIPFAIFEYVYLTIAIAGFAARHIYIVRALVRDAKAFKIQCAKQEAAAISEA